MKPEDYRVNHCLTCNTDFDLSLTACPHDFTPLIKQGVVSIEPLDALYDIEDIRKSRICLTLQLKTKESNQRVIAKIYTPRSNEQREKERFKRIATTLEALNHPSIPRVLQTGKLKDRRPFVLLEYMRGIALMDLLGEGKKLDPLNVCKISIQVCEILEYAHRKNVFPPDLSPGDIIVEPIRTVKDCFWNVSLVDFGKGNPLLHGDNRKAQFTELGDFFGTPEFFAPELLEAREVDGRANIYSLGCIMYLALKGKYAFKGPTWFATLSLHVSEIPAQIFYKPVTKFQERLERIVFKCMSKNPQQRYPSISDLKTELQSLARFAVASAQEQK
jgi:eukaryotic-like serine/threonine-protein kinase